MTLRSCCLGSFFCIPLSDKFYSNTLFQNWNRPRIFPAFKQSSSMKSIHKVKHSLIYQNLAITKDVPGCFFLNPTESTVRAISHSRLISELYKNTLKFNITLNIIHNCSWNSIPFLFLASHGYSYTAGKPEKNPYP